jgi:TRAP-type C4-dicarboxylate transport system permease small subunit
VKRAISGLCGGLAGLALMAIMLLTGADVVGRKFLDASLPGALELTELLMVVVIFAALPLVSLNAEHVVFDSLDGRLSPGVRRLQQMLVDGLCALLLAGLAALLWAKGAQLASYGDTTAQLRLPLHPFVRAMGVLCALTAAVHATQLLRPATRPG